MTSRICLFIIYFLGVIPLCYAFGIADWEHITPGGSTMGDNGSGTYLIIENSTTFKVTKWYFYKRNIIGYNAHKYFIYDERRRSLDLFNSAQEWHEAIKAKKLQPFIWVRWYTDNWIDMDAVLFLLIIGFFISVPLMLVFCWVLYRAIFLEKFRLKRPYTLCTIACILLILIFFIQDHYPSSV